MEKIESKREFNETEFEDLDDVLDHAFFSDNDLEDMEEDESYYDFRDTDFRSIADL